MIIDSQVHIWNVLKQGTSMMTHLPPGPFTPEQLLGMMKAAGVDRAVLVPPGAEAGENEFVLEAARKYPDRFAIMGRFAMDRPGARKRLAAWREQPHMLGIRLIFRGEAAALLSDRSMAWVWATAEKAGIPIMMYPPGLMPAVASIAERHPGLRIVLGHLAIPVGVMDHAVAPHIDQLLPLARLPNVAVKASALPRCSTEAYPFPALHSQVRRVVEAFGPQRVFWGSDTSTHRTPYREVVRMFTEAMDFLSESDRSWIMGRGLAQWLNWKA